MDLSEEEGFVYHGFYSSLKIYFEKVNFDAECFSAKLQEALENSSNPFKLFCFCILKDLHNINNSGRLFFFSFFKEFETFVTNNGNKLNSLLIPIVQLEAFNIFRLLKYDSLQKIIVKCFKLSFSVAEEKNILYQGLYNSLKICFKKGNVGESFSTKTHEALEISSNPFEWFCSCALNDQQINQNLESSFFFAFASEFEAYVTIHKNEIKDLLFPSIQLEAFKIFRLLENDSLKNVLRKCFKLSFISNLILQSLLEELKQKPSDVKKIINCITKLNFPTKYIVYDIVVPLYLQSRTPLVDSFLLAIPGLQIDFLGVLDKLFGNEIEISEFSNRAGEAVQLKSPNDIYKLALQIMKKHNIHPDSCPNIVFHYNKACLKYIFKRTYDVNELSREYLLTFVKELSESNLPLKIYVLNLFVDYDDYFTGLTFALNEKVPVEEMPHQIAVLLSDKSKMQQARQMHQRQVNARKLNPKHFYSLPFYVQQSRVLQIKTKENFKKAIEDINSVTLLGIDTENKPSFSQFIEEELMLIQIAFFNKVYLFDILNLRKVLTTDDFDDLGKLFSNAKIKKITYSFEQDIKSLGRYNTKLKEHLEQQSNIIDLHKIKNETLVDCPNVFPYFEKGKNGHKGLSEMVYLCFGRPLNKREQCSNWAARPLSHDQVAYAALDAFCLLEIWKFLETKLPNMNITFHKETYTAEAFQATSEIDKKSIVMKKKKKLCNNNKNNHKTQTTGSSKNTYASAFKVVCDSMLQGLGKQMRHCNIDTEIIENSDHHEKCVDFYEQERRVILTRGNVYHRLRKFVPQAYIMRVKSDELKNQLEEVVNYFGVIIRDSDIFFARCSICNSNRYIFISPSHVEYLQRPRALNANPLYVKDGKGHTVLIQNGVIENGIKIKFKCIPEQVLKKVSVIYVCFGCGRCYWDGSHVNRMKAKLNSVIQDSVPSSPVLSPPH